MSILESPNIFQRSRFSNHEVLRKVQFHWSWKHTCCFTDGGQRSVVFLANKTTRSESFLAPQ